MKTVSRFLATLLFSLLLLSTAIAQRPGQTELPIDTALPTKQPSTESSPVIVTATASSQRVRYVSIGEVHQTRLQVFSIDGTQVYDSNFKLGNLIDWQLMDQQGQRLTDGSYLFLITVKDFSGNLSQKYGTAALEQEQVYLQQTAQDELSSAQATALDSNKLSAAFSTIDRIGVAVVTRATTASTDGSTAIDTVSSGTKTSTAKASSGGVNITGTGTQNQIAKWTDNAGTLGDSAITEAGGNVGIGVTNPGYLLHVKGAGLNNYQQLSIETTGSVAAGLHFVRPSGGINWTIASTGGGAGQGAGKLLFYRDDVDAAGASLAMDSAGRLGIGTLNPTGGKLDVAGDINTSTQYNIRGSRVLSTSGRMDFLETNIFAGVSAGAHTTPGSPNALFSGFENSFFGFGAGDSNSSGSTNTFVGFTAGSGNTHGNYNTLIGASTFMDSGDLVNATAIGYNARASLSNSLILGNGANVGIGTSFPQTKLQVAGGDVFIATQSNGLILRATDGGNCYRITVNNTGVLSTASVTCP